MPPLILHREELVQRLNDTIIKATTATGEPSTPKLVLLHAPAGYGKTTLLADFARQATVPCCWFLLDRSDSDKITFLERLLTSIRSSFPQFGTTLDPLLTGAIAPDSNRLIEDRLETVVESLIEALETEITERFALILCNYHEVNDFPEINLLINTLLEHPLSCVLVIESRTLPDLEYASLLTRHEMFAMGSELFRLSTQEIRNLAQIQGVAPLSDTEAEQLAISFDGWLAGILLGTRLGNVRFLQNRRKETGGTVPSSGESSGKSIEQQLLFAYVVNEVFKHHSEVYAFLKEACILQEMTPSLCNALLNRTDASERLHYLEQHGLFITTSGTDQLEIYTCHQVLRELLANELHRSLPERYALLHRRAAELLGEAQDYEHAIAHAFTAGANELAAQLILAAQGQLFLQGRLETLIRWMDALPTTIIMRSPRLLLIRARLYFMIDESSHALPLLVAAEEIIAGQPSTIDTNDLPTLQAEIVLLRASVMFRRGAYHDVQEMSQQVLSSLPADEVKLRATAHLRLGICATLLGDFPTALIHLQKVLQSESRHTAESRIVDAHTTLGSLYNLIGNFALSEHHMARAISLREETHDVWGKIYDLIRLGVKRLYRGLFSEAETVLTQALTLATTIHFTSGQAYALDNLGDLYLEQARYERSLVLTEEGLALARQANDTYLINDLLCLMAMTYLYMGDALTATHLLSETDIPPAQGQTIGYERANYELATATILLYQHRYAEATTCLHKLETMLHTAGLKREQFRTQLRLAACYLAQEQISEVVYCLEKVTNTLTTFVDYEQLIHCEIHRLPALEQALRTLPALSHLHALLHQYTETYTLKISSEALPSATDDQQPRITNRMNAPHLRIVAFGEPAVFLQEKPITRWRMARAMELFFFLLDSSRPMRKEQILTALWTETAEQADRTFYSTVYYLRKALGESYLVSQGGSYCLDLTSHFGGTDANTYWYDVAAFLKSHAEAKQALSRNDENAAKEAFEAMVALYQGDYVQSFYSDWCNMRRDELRRIYLDARHHLASITWRKEQYDESADHWQHMLALDNCLEEAHYGLMRYYLLKGKRSQALRQYQRCCENLQQELGVQPKPAIQGLYQRLVTPS